MYNESIYVFNSKEFKYYLWHEYTGQKGSDEIASIIYHFVANYKKVKQINKLTIFADNCTGMIYTFVHR